MSGQTLELLTWISERPRTYAETLAVWRTNCPQHAAWEDALADGLVELVRDDHGRTVALTPSGRAALDGRTDQASTGSSSPRPANPTVRSSVSA